MIKIIIFIMICAGITSITLSSILQIASAYHRPFEPDPLSPPEWFCRQNPDYPGCPHPVCPPWNPNCNTTCPLDPTAMCIPPRVPFPDSTNPDIRCGLTPYGPPCNIPCFNYNNPYCKDDIFKAYTTNLNVNITDNQTDDTTILKGNFIEIEKVLSNQTNIPQLTTIERQNVLNQIEQTIYGLISTARISPSLVDKFETEFEVQYGPTTTSDGNIIYRGKVMVDIELIIPNTVRLPTPPILFY